MRNRSAAWTTAAGVTGTGATAWVVAAATSTQHLPLWPAYAMSAIFIVSMGFLFFDPSDTDALNKQIRRGNRLRDRIIQERWDQAQAEMSYERWFLRARKAVHKHRPAYENRLMLAPAPRDYTGHMVVVGRLNAKIEILQKARESP